LPYSWNGKAITAAGTYSDTLISVSGCDSIATIELVVNSILTSTTNTTICSNQLPYSWNGNTYKLTGKYKVNLAGNAGCDSLATLVLTISPTLTSTTSRTICSNQQTFRWNRKNYTESGNYSDTLKSFSGCDSIVTLSLTIVQAITEIQNIATCATTFKLPNGVMATVSGTYTSRLSNPTGCDKTIVTNLTLQQTPTLIINNPASACGQTTIDLTATTVTTGSDPGLTFKYWKNSDTSAPLINPVMATNGTYYISATTAGGCTTVKPVTATINASPKLIVSNPATVCAPETIDLSNPAITAGSDTGLTFTYWKNAAATISMDNPKAVTTSGTYYIKGAAASGCIIMQAQQVKVIISKPVQSIRYPSVTTAVNKTVELQARPFGNNASYQWNPSTGLNINSVRTPAFNYNKDMEYTIKITGAGGCITVDTFGVIVQVVPNQLRSDIFVPKAWSPNGDGRNDKLIPIPVRIRQLTFFRIFNRWGQIVYETNEIGAGWDGIFNGKPQVTDTYTWMLEAVGQDDRHFKFTGNSILVR